MWSDSIKEITKFPLDFYKMSFWTNFQTHISQTSHNSLSPKEQLIQTMLIQTTKLFWASPYVKWLTEILYIWLKRLSLRINLISVQNECIMKHLLLMP